MSAASADDVRFMRAALDAARLGEGGTRPNPPVGAVLVSPDGRLLATGFHARAGGPHAEIACLRAAPAGAARGATIYVTLEPCSTTGRTGPCTEALIAAGVRRVVCAATDANPAHAGRGFAILRAAGVEVTEGVLREEAEETLAPFFKRATTGMPRLTLKMAQSLDGGTADHAGVSKWITGPDARAEVQSMRRRADVVLVGSGTVLADDPSLLRRDVPPSFTGLPGLRAVLDARGRIPPTARLFSDGHAAETIVLTSLRLCPPERIEEWRAAGAQVLDVPPAFPVGTQGSLCGRAAPALDLRAALRALADLGAMSVLCEGGATLASALLSEGLVDELALFVAPLVLGAGSRGTFGAVPFDLPTAPRFVLRSTELFGRDLLLRLAPESAEARQ